MRFYLFIITCTLFTLGCDEEKLSSATDASNIVDAGLDKGVNKARTT